MQSVTKNVKTEVRQKRQNNQQLSPDAGQIDLKHKLHTTLISNGKRPFVYWYAMVNGKRTRVIRHGYVNREKDKAKRDKLLVDMQHEYQVLLDRGVHDLKYNNTLQYNNRQPIAMLLKKVMREKKAYQTKAASRSHNTHINKFLEFLIERGMAQMAPQMIRQSTMLDYRNWLLTQKKNGNRTVNNNMVDVSAFFTYLLHKVDDYDYKNPCLGIDKLPARSETHVRYTQKESNKIGAWLQANDPTLYLFCQVICYTFLRPNEIRLLKINQLDLANKQITRTAENHKTGKRKIQILQQIFAKRLQQLNLHNEDPNHYLFGSEHKPGPQCFNIDYFNRRFKKCKDALGFSQKHTMYGLKHTFISHLKKNGATDQELMGVTGHETIEALHKYLRDIGAIEARDLSEFYTYEF